MTFTSLLAAALLPTALADAPEPTAEEAAPVPALEEAEPLGYLTPRKVQFLKPKRYRLPQNPYQNTDFTAYSLEFGEWRVGLAGVSVGAIPRLQIGTVPALDVLGIYNGNAKVNLVRVGPVDLAVGGAHYSLSRDDFSGQWNQANATLSARIVQPWSIHVTGSYSDGQIGGSPKLGDLGNTLLNAAMGDSLSQIPEEYRAQAEAEVAQSVEETRIDLSARTATLRVATDIRLNRRDTIVLQGQAVLFAEHSIEVSDDLPDVLSLDEAIETLEQEESPLAETYIASIAYQATWKNLQLRLGAGVSSIPGAWLVQSTDLAWRFGGKTKRGERQMRRAWRQDKRGLRRGAADAVAAAPSLPPSEG